MRRRLFQSIGLCIAWSSLALATDTPTAQKPQRLPGLGIPQGIVVRTTENVTQGGWVWLLNQCEACDIQRIDLLVKQDEDNFHSTRTSATLQSGDLLVPLPGEKTAAGWEDATWLREMLARAKERHIEVWAWWPCFHDSRAAELFPKAASSTKRGERFVDPGFPEVRVRQAELIAKLLETYSFNGVSLDWIRYDGWNGGLAGPLGARFKRQYGFDCTPAELGNGYSKARWHNLRARQLADWVLDLVRESRAASPDVRWGAFLLPWQFTESGQSYPMLGAAGLDFLQPMAYWNDWKLKPDWVGGKLLQQHRDLTSGTAQWPSLGVNEPMEEITRALESIPHTLCSGLSWFNYGSWEQRTFDKVRAISTESAAARQLFGYEPPAKLDRFSSEEIPPAPPRHSTSARPLKAKEFSDDPSVWSVVCLAELYKRGALNEKDGEPVVPVLAFHTFAEGAPGSSAWLYKNSTAYLDALLKFIHDAGFTVCPLSRLHGYLMTRDPAYLPQRPLVLTLDDGSQSVHKLFFPRAVKYKDPFTLALVTSWLGSSEKDRHSTDERGQPDPDMLWSEVKELAASNLVEVVAHSDAMHYQTAENPAAMEDRPALVTRQFLREFNRTETNEEYSRRVRLDMISCRTKLVDQDLHPLPVLCWPYGEWNQTAKSIAEQAGFTQFLLYESPAFATVSSSRDGIPRVPVLRTDEAVPLEFPRDPIEAQCWWLAFLKIARDSGSVPLIRATLAQLTWEGQRTPDAEVSRAVIDLLRGATPSGLTRLLELRTACPFDSNVTEMVEKAARQFNPRPSVDTAH
jgi:hypothetical protein